MDLFFCESINFRVYLASLVTISLVISSDALGQGACNLVVGTGSVVALNPPVPVPGACKDKGPACTVALDAFNTASNAFKASRTAYVEILTSSFDESVKGGKLLSQAGQIFDRLNNSKEALENHAEANIVTKAAVYDYIKALQDADAARTAIVATEFANAPANTISKEQLYIQKLEAAADLARKQPDLATLMQQLKEIPDQAKRLQEKLAADNAKLEQDQVKLIETYADRINGDAFEKTRQDLIKKRIEIDCRAEEARAAGVVFHAPPSSGGSAAKAPIIRIVRADYGIVYLRRGSDERSGMVVRKAACNVTDVFKLICESKCEKNGVALTTPCPFDAAKLRPPAPKPGTDDPVPITVVSDEQSFCSTQISIDMCPSRAMWEVFGRRRAIVEYTCSDGTTTTTHFADKQDNVTMNINCAGASQ
jgi:hypothetical protein